MEHKFSVTDFLELKKAYIGKEQELVEIQERYFMLEQSYQDLQQECQDQQAKLVKQLEKSYEAYHEKFVRVEDLEGKLSECNKNLEKISQHKENQVLILYILLYDSNRIGNVNFMTQIKIFVKKV